MLNGRVNKEDLSVTCVTPRGSSIVDYILVSQQSLSNCSDFKIQSPIELINEFNLKGLISSRSKPPDHALLSFKLCINTCLLQDDNPSDQSVNSNSNQSFRKYNFHQIREDFAQSDSCTNDILELINKIECNRQTQEELDNIYDSLTNTIVNEMNQEIPYSDITCKSKQRKKWRKRQPFWNDELKELWDTMHQKNKLFMKEGHRLRRKRLHEEFIESRHRFDKRFRYFERKFRIEKCTDIERMQTRNPNEFWEQIKQIGPNKKRIIPEEIYAPDGSVIHDKEKVKEK